MLYLTLILFKIPFLYGFAECPNSSYEDPQIVNVTSCLTWATYIQSIGQNFQSICQNNTQIARKCCFTCKAFESFKPCEDKASPNDCQSLARNSLCNTFLSDGKTISFYCERSCGVCKPTEGPKCENLDKICGPNGSCTITSSFGITISRCECSRGYFGHYCNRTDICNSSNPCKNNATCSSVNDEEKVYTCNCPKGCYDKNCTTCTCEAGGQYSCINDGTCKNGICSCPQGFIGSFCEKNDPNSQGIHSSYSKIQLISALILFLILRS